MVVACQEAYFNIPMKSIFSILVIFFLLISLPNCANDIVSSKEKVRAIENMGLSLISQGNLRAGLEQLLKANELDPNNPDLQHELALVYRDLGEYDLSLTHFKSALDLKPIFPEAQNNLGTLYLILNRWDLAIEFFQKAIDNLLYKTPEIAYNNMGLAFYRKGEFRKAIESYKLALGEVPSYTSCYANLGLAYEAVNNTKAAVNAYESAVSIDPEFWAVRFNLGRLYIKLNRTSEAAKEFQLIIKSDPHSPLSQEAKNLLATIDKK